MGERQCRALRRVALGRTLPLLVLSVPIGEMPDSEELVQARILGRQSQNTAGALSSTSTRTAPFSQEKKKSSGGGRWEEQNDPWSWNGSLLVRIRQEPGRKEQPCAALSLPRPAAFQPLTSHSGKIQWVGALGVLSSALAVAVLSPQVCLNRCSPQVCLSPCSHL